MTAMYSAPHTVNPIPAWARLFTPEAATVSLDQPAKVKFQAIFGEPHDMWALVELQPYYACPTCFEVVLTFTESDIPQGMQIRLRHQGRLTSSVNRRSSFSRYPQLRFVVDSDQIDMSIFDILLEPER